MKKITKRQRRQALIKAAEALQFGDNHGKIREKFSCNAVYIHTFYRLGINLQEQYGAITGADAYHINAFGGKYNEKTQLARQLAVLMFMEATT